MNKETYIKTAIEKLKFELSEVIDDIKVYLDDYNLDEITDEVLTKFLHSWYIESKHIEKDRQVAKNISEVLFKNHTELAEVMESLFKDVYTGDRLKLTVEFNGMNISGFDVLIKPGTFESQKLSNTIAMVTMSLYQFLSRSFYEACLEKDSVHYEKAVLSLKGAAALPSKSQVYARFALSQFMFGEIVDEALSKNGLPTVDEMKIQAEKGVFTLK